MQCRRPLFRRRNQDCADAADTRLTETLRFDPHQESARSGASRNRHVAASAVRHVRARDGGRRRVALDRRQRAARARAGRRGRKEKHRRRALRVGTGTNAGGAGRNDGAGSVVAVPGACGPRCRDTAPAAPIRALRKPYDRVCGMKRRRHATQRHVATTMRHNERSFECVAVARPAGHRRFDGGRQPQTTRRRRASVGYRAPRRPVATAWTNTTRSIATEAFVVFFRASLCYTMRSRRP